jgi:hypothetical protein
MLRARLQKMPLPKFEPEPPAPVWYPYRVRLADEQLARERRQEETVAAAKGDLQRLEALGMELFALARSQRAIGQGVGQLPHQAGKLEKERQALAVQSASIKEQIVVARRSYNTAVADQSARPHGGEPPPTEPLAPWADKAHAAYLSALKAGRSTAGALNARGGGGEAEASAVELANVLGEEQYLQAELVAAERQGHVLASLVGGARAEVEVSTLEAQLHATMTQQQAMQTELRQWEEGEAAALAAEEAQGAWWRPVVTSRGGQAWEEEWAAAAAAAADEQDEDEDEDEEAGGKVGRRRLWWQDALLAQNKQGPQEDHGDVTGDSEYWSRAALGGSLTGSSGENLLPQAGLGTGDGRQRQLDMAVERVEEARCNALGVGVDTAALLRQLAAVETELGRRQSRTA